MCFKFNNPSKNVLVNQFGKGEKIRIPPAIFRDVSGHEVTGMRCTYSGKLLGVVAEFLLL